MAGGSRRRSGPPPKPTALKVLQGNPGRRKLNDAEARPEAAVPDCPPELSEIARREWERVAAELHGLGLLTRIDRGLLAGYCSAYGDFIQAEARIRAVGNLVPAATGGVKISPIYRMKKMALEDMHRCAVEFGMSPASRSRVRADVQRAVDEMPADEAFLLQRGLRVVK